MKTYVLSQEIRVVQFGLELDYDLRRCQVLVIVNERTKTKTCCVDSSGPYLFILCYIMVVVAVNAKKHAKFTIVEYGSKLYQSSSLDELSSLSESEHSSFSPSTWSPISESISSIVGTTASSLHSSSLKILHPINRRH